MEEIQFSTLQDGNSFVYSRAGAIPAKAPPPGRAFSSATARKSLACEATG